MLYPWPDSSVVRASGISPEGPGFNPQSGHFGISELYNLKRLRAPSTEAWILLITKMCQIREVC